MFPRLYCYKMAVIPPGCKRETEFFRDMIFICLRGKMCLRFFAVIFGVPGLLIFCFSSIMKTVKTTGKSVQPGEDDEKIFYSD